MLKSVVFVPSAPVLLPDLAGPGAGEVDDVRAAAIEALRATNTMADGHRPRWLVCGDSVGAQSDSAFDGSGTFLGFGADRVVTLSAKAVAGPADPGWPTSMLLAGWYREQADLNALTTVVIDADATVEQVADIGASLRTALFDTGDPTALMVVGDGATSLSTRAPGGGDAPQAHELQARIDAALGSADYAALADLSATECARWGVGGRAVWQAVGAAVSGTTMAARLLYTGSPLGVGYTVATWTALS
ncbi:hypothetical protein [Gordonia sp. CPCC 205333]|uniref:hypothetical protein n=1 Tax=Gordonia sp. CPCC 205333 TaxID=3140790 RepID=UPI003AF3B06B